MIFKKLYLYNKIIISLQANFCADFATISDFICRKVFEIQNNFVEDWCFTEIFFQPSNFSCFVLFTLLYAENKTT